MEIETCNGCVFLEGFITSNYFFAQCGEGIWQGERLISIGSEIAKPTKCKQKIIRKIEEKAKPLRKTTFFQFLQNKFSKSKQKPIEQDFIKNCFFCPRFYTGSRNCKLTFKSDICRLTYKVWLEDESN